MENSSFVLRLAVKNKWTALEALSRTAVTTCSTLLCGSDCFLYPQKYDYFRFTGTSEQPFQKVDSQFNQSP